ncbi:AAA family ATPase [Vibrio parahaemolyticus]|nr:anticodon nuclease [Vibrio parahaemolyticus]EGR2932883.1 anticodon nuclease [Vibrio parahaemolyticus]EGR2956854.1 anticodon nuclease [Vibrio parahaemolyticus]EGR2962118.1 anticodon nuclease [Vibrio parahaemolyticus]EGR2967551.1 anticodon nuclease [Vibrio parahaemolyticus]
MARTLTEIAEQLTTPKTVTKSVPRNPNDKHEIEELRPVPKVQLIYAFNGSGKTRLSKEVKNMVAPLVNTDSEEDAEPSRTKILYYNAFTEDLFYWDNDLENNAEPKLKIQPNSFTNWILKDEGQDQNIISNFQKYYDDKLTPHFNEEYLKDEADPNSKVDAFSEVTFSFQRGNDEISEAIKISKGEESGFVWSVFYTLLELVIETLNTSEQERGTDQFDQLEYVFIDDPVSSLDENHLIDLAANLAKLIKSSNSNSLKFIITTHNPLFYNVLHNEFNRAQKFVLKKLDDGTHDLIAQNSDAPFSYHLQLKTELENAIQSGQLHKYHFNFLRNILEKTSTFLGYEKWGELLPTVEGGGDNPYARIINIYSHSEHASEEVSTISDEHKRVLGYLVRQLDEMYRFKPSQN